MLQTKEECGREVAAALNEIKVNDFSVFLISNNKKKVVLQLFKQALVERAVRERTTSFLKFIG